MAFTDVAAIGAGMAAVPCCKCGIVFHVPAVWDTDRRADHAGFWCPNGHQLSYYEKSPADKLRDELTRERARLDQARAWAADEERRANAAERRVSAQKGVITKIKRRIATGVCPCCHARFRDLRDHMRAKHPDWNPEQGAEAIAAKGAKS